MLGIDLRQLVQAVLFPVLAGFAAGGRVVVVILAVVGVIGLIGRWLGWQRFTYAFDGEVLRVQEGVLSRSHRTLDVARVQQVEIDRSAVARLFGLAALRVETAGSSSEVEVELKVIPLEEAEALRTAIRRGQGATGPQGDRSDDPGDPGDPDDHAHDEDVDGRCVLQVPTGHVLLAAVTGAKLLVFPAVVGVAVQFLGEALGDAMADRAEEVVVDITRGGGLADGITWRTVAIGVLLALTASVLTAAVTGLLRDARFRIDRVDEDLHVTRGLLSTRSSVVPLRRIQVVEVQRNWLRRLLGFTAVRINSAGGSGDADRRVMVPLLPAADVDDLLTELLPGIAGTPALTSHPRAAMRRTVLRWIRQALVLAGSAWLVWRFAPLPVPDAVLWVAAAWVPIAALLGVVEYHQLAHGLTDRVIAARSGALSVTTAIAPVIKVQGASTRANPFQRRLGLIVVVAHVAGPGGDVVVGDAATDDGRQLHARLTEHAADPETLPI